MATTVPFKTPLGNEELRSRKLKLGQRHRTVLFLIDGKRPLAEVLVLAQKAGAETQHFEDLLRLGLVDLPPDPTPPPEPPPEPVEDIELTSVELPVVELPPEEPEEELTERLAAPRGGDRAAIEEAPTQPMPLPEPPRPYTPPPVVADRKPPAQTIAVLTEVAIPAPEPVVPPPPPPPPRRVPPVLKEAVAAPPTSRPFALPPQQRANLPPVVEDVVDINLPLPDESEAQLLQQVRELLTDTLRLDAPLFSARTFMRVRNAQSAKELIDLLWEIQDHMTKRRRPRQELQGLMRARELLGLGNTLVSDETRPPYLDAE